jgi:hypothetical protein
MPACFSIQYWLHGQRAFLPEQIATAFGKGSLLS